MQPFLTKINQFLSNIFALLWIAILLLFYFYHHPDYYYTFQFFQYPELILFLLLGAGSFYGILKFPQKIPFSITNLFTGLGLGIFSSILALFVFLYQFNKVADGIDLTAGMAFSFFGQYIWTLIGLFLLVTFCYGVGNFLLKRFQKSNQLSINYTIISIGIGIIGITLSLMLLGSLTLLKGYILFPLIGLTFLLLRNSIFSFIKKTLFKPIDLSKQINLFGASSLFLLLFWVIINFLSLLRPIPFGYDSLTLYSQIPSLINDYGALVEGYQPYNWSLFMSLGYLVFKQTEFVLCISFLGGILSLFAFYNLLRRWLDINTSLFCLLLFFSLPTINFLAYNDIKIDLGLLFILLLMVLVLLDWMEIKNNSNNYSNILLLGIFSGFAIGIKLTALFAVFGILAVFAFYFYRFSGLIASFCLIFFVLIFFNLDQLNGLRNSFNGIQFFQWLTFFIGLGLLGYAISQKKSNLIPLLKTSSLYLLFLGLTFLPWLIKNYSETKKIDTTSLLNGSSNEPEINFIIMEQMWREKYLSK